MKNKGRSEAIRRVVLVMAMAAMLVCSMAGCAGCAGCNGKEEVNNIPTVTVAPTPTERVETTKTPEASVVVPSPKPTNTPVPTNTPTPTNTPVPTVTVAPTPVIPEEEPYATYQMGDNVWYDYYDNGMLVVRGSGATWDFDAKERYSFLHLQEEGISAKSITSIVIEEGLTEIGEFAFAYCSFVESIVFSESVERIENNAFQNVGKMAEEITWTNLDTDKVEISPTAFYGCNGLDSIKDAEKYSVSPTPTPAPTATPIPDPNKPRLYASRQMGDNVTFEFWDNGYLYVKGSGATWDNDWTFMAFRGEQYSKTHTVIVEEGVTYLGDFIFNDLDKISYYKLPKTLTNVGETSGASGGIPTAIDSYYDGKFITLKCSGTMNPGQFNDNVRRVMEKGDGYTYTYTSPYHSVYYEVIYH